MLMVLILFRIVDVDFVDILGCGHRWHNIYHTDIIADVSIFGPIYQHIGLR
jgi:hypothetical protein